MVLPAFNAVMNATSAILACSGYLLIRRGRTAAHHACMIAALAASTLFLGGYLLHHARVGSVPFRGTGAVRGLYFAILGSHTILAAAIVPLVAITLTRALRGRFETHARIARWTLPIWLYVSVTGVIIYLMLYRMHFD
jgi:uncharacterized membrane protein YozB (DUF420 family)